MPLTVIPSTPGLPLLALTCRSASFKFSRSHTSSISRSVPAGLSVPCVAGSDSVASLPVFGASPLGVEWKSSFIWVFCRLSLLRFMSYSPLLSFGPSPSPDNMPSADFCPVVRLPLDNLSRRSDAGQISWGKFSRLPCTVAGSTLRVFDGYGLRGKWPARPMLAPCTRFLSIDPHVCSTLPSDLASRRQSLRCHLPFTSI